MYPQSVNMNMLQHNWTATVLLKNDMVVTVWWSWWPMGKDGVKEILSVSSDYPAGYSIQKICLCLNECLCKRRVIQSLTEK